MNVDALRDYIAYLRTWLDQEATPCMPPESMPLLESWRDELSTADGLLQEKPELPIAFLGPSQQGKSSLINALLGQNILAVGGAIGACTSVITSVHFDPADTFRAEIHFISLTDWKSELLALEATLSTQASEDDTDVDREELEADQNAAVEKFKAVYQAISPESLAIVLNHPNLGLPEDIVKVMATGECLTFRENNSQTLRNRVRRYLVGREQSDDAQFWPLISRVRIFGNFEVLSSGVVLIDLPGLNDPNPAREQVTKRYLAEARYIWLVCNSQTGIDRVFTQVLRENGFLFRLYMEGRLSAFSVVATRVDDMNLEVVLGQMGVDPSNFDGKFAAPLEFRRKEIRSHVQRHLLTIAEEIASKAEATEHRSIFIERIKTIPVFAISTTAYLHAVGRMPLYQGMPLSRDESRVPRLIKHLHSITREHSFQAQVEAASRRLQMLHDQIHRFFLNRIQGLDRDSTETRQEWANLCRQVDRAVPDGLQALRDVEVRSSEMLQHHCDAFEQQLRDLHARAEHGLHTVFSSWQSIHWRTLQAAVSRRGEWFSRSLQRDYNLSRDVARAYLELLPFIWEEFFGTRLAKLVVDAADGTRHELQRTADHLKGSMAMLRHQPNGIQESMEASLRTAGEAFALQSKQIGANLTAQIQRTRQDLSSGTVETAAVFMRPAFEQAAQCPSGRGIKQRMLDVIVRHAAEHAPALFINMRQDLDEGVAVLRGSMTPQLTKMVGYGRDIMDRFRQNFSSPHVLTPQNKDGMQHALDALPQPVTTS